MNWLYRLKWLFSMRDEITCQTIAAGTILRVYPKIRSAARTWYDVKVVTVTPSGFRTELLNPEQHNNDYVKPHSRWFRFGSFEWACYHRDRFKILKR